ncbi:GntR family transcriptional regulator [Corynebacterium macginleyi]
MYSLDRQTHLYCHIADELRSRITNGELRPGNVLPSERTLSEQFEASRITIRRALDILGAEGLIERRRGRGGGTFIKSTAPTVEINRMEGFLPQLRARGRTVESQVLATDLVSGHNEIVDELRLEPRSQVFRIVRLRKVSGVPMLIENSFFPISVAPDLLDQDLTGSLYELLAKRYDVKPSHKKETITPEIPTSWEQKKLQLRPNQPILRLKRTTFGGNDAPIEFSRDVLRCDLAQVEIVTTPSQGA